MRLLIILCFLFSTVAKAELVTVEGRGETYDKALSNAKESALGKVAGSFVMSQKNSKDNNYSEDIVEYNSGSITSYDIIDSYYNYEDKLYVVIIQADVNPKKNNLLTVNKPTEFQIDWKEYNDRAAVVGKLNKISNMLSVVVQEPKVGIGTYQTKFRTKVVFTYQPKWISDMESFAGVVGHKGKVRNNFYEKTHGNIVASLLSRSPLAAVLVYEAGKPQEYEKSDQMMTCFAKKRGSNVRCYDVGVEYTIPRSPMLIITGVTDTGEIVLHRHLLDTTDLYQYVQAGSTISRGRFKTINYTFDQPALIVYKQEKLVKDMDFYVENSTAKTLKRFNVYLK